MPPLARRHAIAVLIGLLILWFGAMPSQALDLPGLPWGTRSTSGNNSAVAVEGPNGRLQEVAAPGGVQQLRNGLARRQPLVQLQSPNDGSILGPSDTSLTVSIKDWPLVADDDLGLGPHLALQIDDQPPLRFTDSGTTVNGTATLEIPLPALSPGSHRFTAYAAYPWGEAVKSPGASQQWRLHQLQALKGTQPERNDPWLVMVSPAELGSHEPLLLDWMVWNAPLQNLRDGDGRWRLRLTLNGDSFLVDRQEAIWLRQGGSNQPSTMKPSLVQMELLDGLGDPINPAFNNQLRALPPRPASRPIWLQAQLSETEFSRLLGESQPAAKPATDVVGADASPPEPSSPGTEVSPTTEDTATDLGIGREDNNAAPTDSTNSTNSTNGDEADHNSNAPTNGTGLHEPEQAQPTPPDAPESQAKAPAPPLNGEERLTPTTSLGGSARELLKPEGPKR
jgi:hypothetical protein